MSYEYHQVHYATHNLHTAKNGIFKSIEFNSELEEKIIKKVIYKKTGDTGQFFDGANKAIGIIFMKFFSVNEMLNVTDNINRLINIIVE